MAVPALGMASGVGSPCELIQKSEDYWAVGPDLGAPGLLCLLIGSLAGVGIWRPRPGSAVHGRHLVACRAISAAADARPRPRHRFRTPGVAGRRDPRQPRRTH